MFFRILKLDLKKKKVMNILLLLFVILASLFSASGLNNIITVLNGTDYYFDKAGIGDYAIVANKNNNLREILDGEKTIKNYRAEPGIIALKSNVKKNHEPLESGTNVIFQAIEDTKINFFDNDDKVIKSVKQGEVYITGRCMEKSNLSIGDEITIDFGDTKYNVKIAGKAKDALLGSDFMGMTRFIFNKSDYEKIYNTMYKKTDLNEGTNTKNNQEEHGYEIFYVDMEDPTQMDKILANASSITFKGGRDTLKLTYVMDMIIAFVILVASVGLIIVALLVLKFTITFTVNDEYREIGVMKAIGIKNSGIRNLYIIKYFSLAVIGATIGYFLSMPFGNYLIKSSTENMVLGNTVGNSINIIGAIFVILVTVLFAYIYTGKVKKASPVDAIRYGQTGERYKAKTIYKMEKSHIRINLYMAINDILSAPKRYITMIISFFVCLVLVLSVVVTTDTMKSKNLIATFCTESDVYFVPGNAEANTLTEAISKESFEEDFKKYEKFFADNGMPGKMSIELQFNVNLIFNGETYNIKTQQGFHTKAEDYAYFEGIAPVKENEVAITDVVSKKTGAKIGDKIKIDDGKDQREVIITAYYQSLNNRGEIMRFTENSPMNFKNFSGTGWYQYTFTDNPSDEEIKNRIEKMKELLDTDQVLDAVGMCAENIGVVPTMESVQYLLLGITIIVVFLVTLLMEMSFVTNEKSQIALLKAIGFKDIHIIKLHMYRFLISTLIAEVLAAILALPITQLWCNQVFGMMGANNINYYLNPINVYLKYPAIVFIATIIASFIASLATKKIKCSDTANIE